MFNHSDPEDLAAKTISLIRYALRLVPEAKILVLIDHPDAQGSDPAGLFSQISYDRAVTLLRTAQATAGAAHEDSLRTIAKAMTGQQHG